jgi:hypothetical protein
VRTPGSHSGFVLSEESSLSPNSIAVEN